MTKAHQTDIDPELQQFYDGLLTSVKQMKTGQTKTVYSPVIEARQQTGLSQTSFAKLLGVSVRTFQEWEQGRRQPTGAAKTLIAIARHSPEVLRAVAQG